MKKIFFITIVLFFLFSCSKTQENITPIPTQSGAVKNTTSTGENTVSTPTISKQEMMERKKNNILLKTASKEVQWWYKDLEQAQKDNDRDAREKILTAVRDFEKKKRTELSQVVKTQDKKKAQELRKELEQFDLFKQYPKQ